MRSDYQLPKIIRFIVSESLYLPKGIRSTKGRSARITARIAIATEIRDISRLGYLPVCFRVDVLRGFNNTAGDSGTKRARATTARPTLSPFPRAIKRARSREI